MKISVLNGSPRAKGNTRILLKAFEEGVIKHMDDTSIDFIDLGDKTIKPCEACDACIGLKGKCKHKDDTNEVLEKLTHADAIVFGSPVYWWGISTQLKAVVDKFYTWQALDYKVHGKKIGLIAVGGNKVDDPQYQLISDQFKYISNFLKWDVSFDEAFKAYTLEEILEDKKALKTCKELYKRLL